MHMPNRNQDMGETSVTTEGNDSDGEWDDEPESLDVEQSIADYIATLSQLDDSPTEFDPPGRTIEPSEVDFASAAWMGCLIQVQGWLRLDDSLSDRSPQRFADSLAIALGVKADGGEAVDLGGVALPEIVLQRLQERLERAVTLQEQFAADLQAEGASRKSATGRWISAWEDEVGEDEPTSGPVSATADTWPIYQFIDSASDDQLNLNPSYQRGDVWPTSDAQQLIESILRGIPLPSVILLRPEEPELPYEVVDGKQRLTSILRFVGKHPRAIAKVEEVASDHPDADFPGLFRSDYPKFRRKWKNLTGEQLTATREREYYFPFRLRTGSPQLSGPLAALQGKYYSQIREEIVEIANSKIQVRKLFEKPNDYKVPVIEYSQASRQQIHEVFNLYNKQGKHLNAEEIRNAVYHELDLTRALLVVSGDNRDVEGVAPFLAPDWPRLELIAESLDDYGFGIARYRRSKLLSWLSAMVIFDVMDDGQPRRLATARHIDALLRRIQDDTGDPMRDPTRVRSLFTLVGGAVDAHSAVDEAWAPKFKDTKSGLKWQELQLVASLVGVTISAAVLGDEIESRLSSRAETLHSATSSKEWQRPKKTQTASQWDFIASISLKIVEGLGVDPDEANDVLVDRFGFSGVGALQVVKADIDNRDE